MKTKEKKPPADVGEVTWAWDRERPRRNKSISNFLGAHWNLRVKRQPMYFEILTASEVRRIAYEYAVESAECGASPTDTRENIELRLLEAGALPRWAELVAARVTRYAFEGA